MQNRTDDITRQYWILNDQYRLLNTTILNAIENHQKVKSDYRINVRRSCSKKFSSDGLFSPRI